MRKMEEEPVLFGGNGKKTSWSPAGGPLALRRVQYLVLRVLSRSGRQNSELKLGWVNQSWDQKTHRSCWNYQDKSVKTILEGLFVASAHPQMLTSDFQQTQSNPKPQRSLKQKPSLLSVGCGVQLTESMDGAEAATWEAESASPTLVLDWLLVDLGAAVKPQASQEALSVQPQLSLEMWGM